MLYLSLYIIRVLSQWSGHAHYSLFTKTGAKLRLFLVTAKLLGLFFRNICKLKLYGDWDMKKIPIASHERWGLYNLMLYASLFYLMMAEPLNVTLKSSMRRSPPGFFEFMMTKQ